MKILMTHRFTLHFLASLIFMLICNNPGIGQEDKVIPSKKLLKDFEKFEEMIDAHPDPYTHVSEAVVAERLAQINSSLSEDHTPMEYYKKLASLVALIKDGHSSVSLPKFWMVKKRKEFGCFPYEMHLTNSNELFVLKNLNKGEIEPGSKIVSINGITVDSFLNRIDPYISYERLSFRNTIIDDDFEKYLYLAFGKSANLTFKSFKEGTIETVVKNMPIAVWRQFEKKDLEEGERLMEVGKPYAYKKIKDGIGMLSIYGFFAKDFNMYNQFLIKTFKTIEKDSIHSLIIDIRGNYGGWPKIASELFHYIHDSYFKTFAKSSMKVSQAYKNYLYDRYPSLRTNTSGIVQRRHYVDISSIVAEDPGTFIDEDKFFNEEPIDEKFEFKGDAYLLINRDSYSAASSFASTFQCYGMGLIIGEETGGTKIFRANPITKELDHSGVFIRMSTTKLYTACYSEELQGVTPNVEYKPSIFELLSHMDTEMIYAMRVIKKVRKKRAAEMEAEAKEE